MPLWAQEMTEPRPKGQESLSKGHPQSGSRDPPASKTPGSHTVYFHVKGLGGATHLCAAHITSGRSTGGLGWGSIWAVETDTSVQWRVLIRA
jgi:hypothetical protein